MDAPSDPTQQQPQPYKEQTSIETHTDLPASTQPHTNTPPLVQLLSALPPPLLALVASHLPPVSLLLLQRCSSTLHRLRSDELYMTAAWRRAELHVSMEGRLLEWALAPASQCINSIGNTGHLIPVSVWQSALPALREVVTSLERVETNERYKRVAERIRQSQPTVWILAKRGDRGWQAVDAASAEQREAVQRVEVVRDVNWQQMMIDVVDTVPLEVAVRCQLVLRATPHLQHFHLTLHRLVGIILSHAKEERIFVLVPHLRSLTLEQSEDDLSDEKQPYLYTSILDSLPDLTSLRCINISNLSTAFLLDLASHSTLEELYIDSDRPHSADQQWIGRRKQFPISVVEDEQLLQRDAVDWYFSGDIEQENTGEVEAALGQLMDGSNQQLTSSGDEEKEREKTAVARMVIQRTRTALTRTQPTERSCRVRLALADWLHRRLRRGKLYTEYRLRPKLLLRLYRMQVALLRSTLRRQLSELTAATQALLQTDALVSTSSTCELGRASKRARVEGL